ncbi:MULTISPECIES: tRNA preQ1(34) S-adenosylmethionine ribosyltransferase-isomerase QueA [Dehalobacter]|jgi:S-adenosylmethionine:tRNA ribosyltransferase-isomerase|uniref:S-adenosylmethionine:tRNA ribosyltransferase-isomerase n=2 Tax=Dehalobacter restrictus TaxID=55583 RepID=A0A857DIJ4_9FIRM|nr:MULTISPECIES: tRNA preQ1(34) S-adenosylmethionine ribosyltransferase-isomerase QueA [Dehalobacter]AHF10155.1 S-adenosylmethionine tRNA ribosyltransferase [Dehalobacter restrictus DSM 9455]MCG1025044.1 tRNA preQ1(34) S-adenosylmethionine ribosyltransferase-isomerase QueA [Dehalobacter sp.]MDJ0305736.1 tRNA preQ1(34) S-adenosylmethionine ribosyltransferase-isomerase QueA [Dehalobacter sp.]OCZ52608.1 tRNA preQ1(34) S-adenosylmethionine ribosyltransferase-isomerase QueA [Dehalobacter sp. TeCB1]
MRLEDFDYDLPERLIAQTPAEPRDSSRLMLVDKAKGEIFHYLFQDIVQFFNAGDVLVLNKTRVIPARLIGQKEGTGAKIEVLLLKRIDRDRWEVLVKPGKRLKQGQTVVFGGGLLRGELIGILDDGNRIIHFTYSGLFEEVLDSLGEMPLPPYITAKLNDKERYQTVYAKENGSAAAPTAGLHFTEELLQRIRDNGVEVLEVLLHVGLGTFRPVKTEEITEHQMHTEYFSIDSETAAKISLAKKEGRRVIAVGTTVVRTLESAAGLCQDASGNVLSETEGWTDIFIYPGYQFKIVDALITNFHFPRSTLLMLVSAFAGREMILEAYQTAVREKYRFFSFGDAMFLV